MITIHNLFKCAFPCVALSLVGVTVFAGAPVSKQDQPVPAAPASTGAWPQSISGGGRAYMVYAPQFESYGGDAVTLTQGVRRSISGVASTVPTDIGLMSVSATVNSGAADGELEISGFQIDSLSFAGSPATQDEISAIQNVIGNRAISITRRALVHDMTVQNARASSTPGLGDFVPQFMVEKRRTVLMSIDGDPLWKNLGDTNWRQVINTPFLILQAQDGSFVVRLGSTAWMGSSSFDSGYTTVNAPPAAVIAAIGTAPPAPVANANAGGASGFSSSPPTEADRPAIKIVTQPTVLISMNGEPVLAEVAPGIQWVANSRAPLLKTATPPAWWTLAAGRWFTAGSLDGPWSRAAPASIPAGFTLLPGGRGFDAMKASVPRTPESVAAVAAAQEPRSVQISRATAQCNVVWRGQPMWQAIDGTLLRGSVNASQPVIQSDQDFFCCDNAVWFRGTSPTGPWYLCDDLPDALATIPAESPLFPVTAVEIAGSTDSAVTYSYDPGYFGTFIDNGTVVFGTGFDSPGVALPDNGWMPQPATYGMPAEFDLDTGAFAPSADDADQEWQPALDPDVYVEGYPGWGWCPGWTSAWGWGWRNPSWWDHWGDWWRNWNPYWNRWANARTDRQRARDAAADAERAERVRNEDAIARQAADDQRRMTDQETEWRRRMAENRERSDEALRQARAEDVRMRDERDAAQRADDQRSREAQARSGPTAARGSLAWWYQFGNDHSNGYVSRATGYHDPRYSTGAGKLGGDR